MKASVFGLGYVGTTTATCLAARGHRVVGVDINREKIAALNACRSPVAEPGLEEILAAAVSAGNLLGADSITAGWPTPTSPSCVGAPLGTRR